MTKNKKMNPSFERRAFLAAVGLPIIAGLSGVGSMTQASSSSGSSADSEKLVPASKAVDHLVFGFSDLEKGIAWTEQNLGVKAVFGGVHPGAGTRNALLSLGGRKYLEVIAPDPAQPGVAGRFGDLKALASPRIITWASATDAIAEKLRLARGAGYHADGPREGSRARPDGKLLQWETLNITSDLGGVIPFFIQWGAGSMHPSEDSPAGCSLEDLRFEHPRPEQVASMLANLGIEARVMAGKEAKLIATLKTPKGRVTFF